MVVDESSQMEVLAVSLQDSIVWPTNLILGESRVHVFSIDPGDSPQLLIHVCHRGHGDALWERSLRGFLVSTPVLFLV